MQEPNTQSGPLAHSMVMLFIGITLLIGITMGGLFLFGEERGETGIPTPEEIGVATAPLQQAPAEIPQTPQVPAQPMPVTPPPSQSVPSEPVQRNTQKCLQGGWTASYVSQFPEETANAILPDEFKPYNRLYTKLARDLFRIDTFNSQQERYYVSAIRLDKAQEKILAERKATAQTISPIEENGVIQVYTILSEDGDDFGIIEIRSADPLMFEIFPRGNSQDNVRITSLIADAARTC